jgi:hypothetical protein
MTRRTHGQATEGEEIERCVQPRYPWSGSPGTAAASVQALSLSLSVHVEANCLASIFAFLSLGDMARGLRTCRHWQLALRSSRQLANFSCQALDQDVILALGNVRTSDTLCRHLQTLDLDIKKHHGKNARGYISFSSERLLVQNLPRALPNLTHLRASMQICIPFDLALPLLRELYLSEPVNKEQALVLARCPRLERLWCDFSSQRNQERAPRRLTSTKEARKSVSPAELWGLVVEEPQDLDEEPQDSDEEPQDFDELANLLAIMQEPKPREHWTHWYAHHLLNDEIVEQMSRLQRLRVVQLCINNSLKVSHLGCLAHLPALADLYLRSGQNYSSCSRDLDPQETWRKRGNHLLTEQHFQEAAIALSAAAAIVPATPAAAAIIAAASAAAAAKGDDDEDEFAGEYDGDGLVHQLVIKLPPLPNLSRLFIDLDMQNSELKALLKRTPELRELSLYRLTALLDCSFLDDAVPKLQHLHVQNSLSYLLNNLTPPRAMRLQSVLSRCAV